MFVGNIAMQNMSVFLNLLVGASEMLGLGNKINCDDIFNLIS